MQSIAIGVDCRIAAAAKSLEDQLRKAELSDPDADLAFAPSNSARWDSTSVELTLAFVAGGGLTAIAAFSTLLAEVLKRVFPSQTKIVIVVHGERHEVDADSTAEDIQKLFDPD